MPFKTGSWGEQAQARNIRRTQYFRTYQRKRYGEKRAEVIEGTRQWQIQNPEKIKAENLARYHIPIPKDQLCEYCYSTPAKHRHHTDYSKPLEVMFLCISCHRKVR